MAKYVVWLEGIGTLRVPYMVEAESEEDAIEQQTHGDGVYLDELVDWSFDRHVEITRTAEPYEEKTNA